MDSSHPILHQRSSCANVGYIRHGACLGETVISAACIDKHQQLKMNIPIIILAVLGLVCGKHLQTGSLKDDVKEFMAQFPTDKILHIVMDYLANDEEVREFVAHIQSEEFPKIHKTVEQLQQYKDCFSYINDQGVDVYAIVNQIHDTLGYPPYQPTNTNRNGVGFFGLIDDVIAVLPLGPLRQFMGNKMESREYFKKLVAAIHSPVWMSMVDTVRAFPQNMENSVQSWPEYHELHEILQNMSADGQHITNLTRDVFMRETQSLQEKMKEFMAQLQEDLKEFKALDPTHKVLEITLDYLANDPQFNEAYAYVQSEEFPRIHKIVEYLKQYKDCFKFINDQGVDVPAIVNQIHYTLGYPPFQPSNTTHTGVGLQGLKHDVIAALPLDDLKALYHEKTETREYFKTLDKYFKTLVTALNSPAFKKMVDSARAFAQNKVDSARAYAQNMVDTVRAWPEYQELLEIVREYGVDRDRITEYIWEHSPYLWEQFLRGTRWLQQQLEEFMAQFQYEKHLEIAMDYLANDEEVREFVAYIQSEEFPKIHKTVEQLQQYEECFNYFNNQGVDVYAIISQIHVALGYPPYQPTNTNRNGVGFYGLIDDEIAVLPFHMGKKMESKKFFNALATALNTPAFKNMVDTVRAFPQNMVNSVQSWPEYHEIREILQNMAADVQRITNLVRDVYMRETQSLRNQLKNYMALVPAHKVLEITLDYLANDPQFNEAYAYVQSEEYPRIHNIVEYLKEYKNCFNFINDQGVDVHAIVNQIHDTLGYPPYQPTNTTRSGVGLHGLKNDVIAAFPIEDWKNLYSEKVESREYYKTLDKYYKTLVTALKSPAVKNMVETLQARPEYQQLLQTLRQIVDRITEYYREQFGSHSPHNRTSEHGN